MLPLDSWGGPFPSTINLHWRFAWSFQMYRRNRKTDPGFWLIHIHTSPHYNTDKREACTLSRSRVYNCRGKKFFAKVYWIKQTVKQAMGLIQLHSGAVNGSCSDEVHCLDNMVKDKSYRKYQQTPLSIDGKVLNANKKKASSRCNRKSFPLDGAR